MEASLRPPRRRLRVRERYEAPFPLRSRLPERAESRLPERAESRLRAELVNQHVLVCDPHHIRRIYSQGFFGKGILSRSKPEHSDTDQWEHQGVPEPVMSQSRGQTPRWAGSAPSPQGLDEDSFSQSLSEPAQPIESVPEKGAEPGAVGGACPDHRCDRQVPVPREGEAFLLTCAPFCLTECLQLSLEETFFLVYSLGCLSVHQQQEPLSIIQLWRRFRVINSDFVSSYAAYHHLRSRGWVPKEGGAKYGTDFMLYRRGPPFYHSSYSVVVQRADGAFRNISERQFSWRSLAALSRITASVSKDLMLCYVVYPTDLSQAELESPDCLRRLFVQEVVVQRWVSSKEREEQEEL